MKTSNIIQVNVVKDQVRRFLCSDCHLIHNLMEKYLFGCIISKRSVLFPWNVWPACCFKKPQTKLFEIRKNALLFYFVNTPHLCKCRWRCVPCRHFLVIRSFSQNWDQSMLDCLVKNLLLKGIPHTGAMKSRYLHYLTLETNFMCIKSMQQ